MPWMEARPYPPLQTLKPFGEGLWLADGPVIRMGYAGLTSIPFPTRMVAARIEGGLWLHSPVEWSEGLAAELAALGPVRAIVAPNRLHVAFAPDWAERYPEAEVYAEPEALKVLDGRIARAQALAEAPPPLWAGEIEQLILKGPALSEAAFFHRASRTLVLTDLIEAFEPDRVEGRLARWLLRRGGVTAPGRTPRDIAASFMFRRRPARLAAETMRAWRPARISLAHGRVIETDADAALARAFAWTGMRD